MLKFNPVFSFLGYPTPPLPYSRNRGAWEHCFWGPKTEIFKGKFHAFFLFEVKSGLFHAMLVENLSQSPNFPNFDKLNFSTSFIYNFRQNFYCCIGQIRDISAQNTLKMAKISNSYKFYARKTEIFQ